MEALRSLFSSAYKEQRRLEEKHRVEALLKGKDLTKPVVLHTDNGYGYRNQKYLGVRITGQDKQGINIEGKCYVTSKSSRWDVETARRHDSMNAHIFGGKKKIPFIKVVSVRQ